MSGPIHDFEKILCPLFECTRENNVSDHTRVVEILSGFRMTSRDCIYRPFYVRFIETVSVMKGHGPYQTRC